MKAAIARICVLGQQLEALQANTTMQPPDPAGDGEPVVQAKDPTEPPREHPAPGHKEPPKGTGPADMEVEATLPATGGNS
eukprot:2745956-Amphidinium_carterae.2